MDFLKIEKFLCKWPIRTGCITIGLFYTASSFIYFLSYVVQMASAEAETENELHKFHIASSLVNICIGASLLYGTLKGKRIFMLPFLLCDGSTINVITFLILTYSLVEPLILVLILLLAPFIYCLMCVYSYYAELDPLLSGYPNNMMNQRTMDQVKLPEDI